MTTTRTAAVLAGQTTIAQKVFAAIPPSQSNAYTAFEISRGLKAVSGSSPNIHVLRGCLAKLKDCGLIKEVVPGSFRRAELKDKEKVEMPKSAVVMAIPAKAVDTSPLELLSGIASKLRAAAGGLGALADELDNAAIAIEDRAAAGAHELAKVKQIATLLKELG